MLRVELRQDLAAIVEVEIQLPADLRRERRAFGLNSESVAGKALIDTGADVTGFDLAAAARVGLPSLGTSRLMTVLGPHDGEIPRLLGEVTITGFGAFSVPQGRGFDLSDLGLVAVIGKAGRPSRETAIDRQPGTKQGCRPKPATIFRPPSAAADQKVPDGH